MENLYDLPKIENEKDILKTAEYYTSKMNQIKERGISGEGLLCRGWWLKYEILMKTPEVFRLKLNSNLESVLIDIAKNEGLDKKDIKPFPRSI